MSIEQTTSHPDGGYRGSSGQSEVGIGNWSTVVRQLQKRLVRNRVSLSAGSLAYHWFLALFPAVIALVGLLAVLHLSPGNLHHLTHAVDVALPTGVSGVFDSAINTATRRSAASTVAIVLGVLIALWSSSGGIAALEQALDIAYEVPLDRKYLARRVRALPLMAATVVLGGGGAALMVFGAPLGAAIEGHVLVHGVAFVVVWTIVRWAFTTCAVSLLFSIFYFLGPNRVTPKWTWVSPGGTLATVVFLGASVGFSFYVEKFGSYGKTYGTFAGVAILIFWLYLTGLAILIGGEMNAELERTKADRMTDEHPEYRT